MSQYVPKAVLDSIFTDLEMIQELPFSMFQKIILNKVNRTFELHSDLYSISINDDSIQIECHVPNRVQFIASKSIDAVVTLPGHEQYSFNCSGQATAPYTNVHKEYATKLPRLMSNVAERIKKRLARVDFL